MGVLYLNPADHLRQRNFEVFVPAWYHYKMPEHLTHPQKPVRERANPYRLTPVNFRNPAPFRQIPYPDELQKAGYSIEIMLDMCKKHVQFELAVEDDVVEILDALDRYILSMKSEVELGHQGVIEALKPIFEFRKKVFPLFARYMFLNPAAKERLEENNTQGINLFRIFQSLSTIHDPGVETDPVMIRKDPPYSLEEVAPKPKAILAEDSIGNDLGIASGGILPNDIDKFDFEDFLKRR